MYARHVQVFAYVSTFSPLCLVASSGSRAATSPRRPPEAGGLPAPSSGEDHEDVSSLEAAGSGQAQEVRKGKVGVV